MIAEERERILDDMYLDMQLFAELCFPRSFTIQAPAFHRELYDAYQDDSIPRIVCVAPRHHAKSTVTSLFFPLHHILFNHLFGGGPRVVVLISKTEKQAKKLLGTIKDALDTNREIKAFFGEWGRKTAKVWSMTEIILKDDSAIFAIGTGQQVHGIKHLNQRPTLVVIDDPEDDENTRTQDATGANLDWIIKAVDPAMDEDCGRMVVIGTMIMQGCIVDVLSNPQEDGTRPGAYGWHCLWFDAIVDEDKKQTLWPQKFSWDALERKRLQAKSIGREHIWYMNYRNMIVAGDKQPFKPGMIGEWDGELVIDAKRRRAVIHASDGWSKPINIFWGFDPASSTSDRADNTVWGFIGIDHRRNVYALLVYREREDPVKTVKLFFEQVKIFAPLGGNVETVGYQETIRSQLRELSIKHKVSVPGAERKNQPRGSKSGRILSNLYLFQEGRFFLKKGENPAIKREIVSYIPDRESQHEDVHDFFYYALKDSFPCSEDWYKTEEGKKPKMLAHRRKKLRKEVSWMGC